MLDVFLQRLYCIHLIIYNLSKKHFIDIGIDIEGEVKVDLNKMMSNKVSYCK